MTFTTNTPFNHEVITKPFKQCWDFVFHSLLKRDNLIFSYANEKYGFSLFLRSLKVINYYNTIVPIIIMDHTFGVVIMHGSFITIHVIPITNMDHPFDIIVMHS